LRQLHHQRQRQRAIKDRIAGRVDEIGQQDRVLLRQGRGRAQKEEEDEKRGGALAEKLLKPNQEEQNEKKQFPSQLVNRSASGDNIPLKSYHLEVMIANALGSRVHE